MQEKRLFNALIHEDIDACGNILNEGEKIGGDDILRTTE